MLIYIVPTFIILPTKKLKKAAKQISRTTPPQRTTLLSENATADAYLFISAVHRMFVLLIFKLLFV